ncbi:MAG: succinate dehydrogenase, cytochrome b556 subunit [Rhodoferax sp.]|nr:succinate dehydrogenase, cytochrome b556 subunit [Rhodoferax sp.]
MNHTKVNRPTFFNLTQLQLPVGALTSILHRVSGVLLALGVPASLYLLELWLQSPQTYSQVGAFFENQAVQGAAILLAWALAHHSLAGLRHMLSDIDIGSQLPTARRSAWIVNVCGIGVALLAAGALR